jgi:hypothetical protein
VREVNARSKFKLMTESRGAPILLVLLILFVVLKLAGAIVWSWWLVLIPLWIALGGWLLAVIVVGVFMSMMGEW